MSADTAAKYALVTGSSKGIGKVTAIELARAGHDVAVNYNSDAAGAADTIAEIEKLGRKGVAIQANVGLSADVSRMFAEYDAAFPRIDTLVCNAAVQTWKAFLDLTEAEWDKVLNTNLKGSFLCIQQAARRMKDAGTGGAILTLGSGCNQKAFPRLVDYTASKGGIEMLTKVAAVELGKFKIRVNCVAPGATEVERTKAEAGDYAGTWAKETPMGRVGYPADIAHAIVFLASDKAEFVTGQTLFVDGGVGAKPQWPYEW